MKFINKVLGIFKLSWVVRKRIEFATKCNNQSTKIKKLLIFKYRTSSEKILFETEYK